MTGAVVALGEEKEFAISGKQKVSVRVETNAVSDTRIMIVQNRHPITAPASEPPTLRGRSASRKRNLKGWSPSEKFNRPRV